MYNLAGKTIPSTLEELLQHFKTALLVIDLQNDFCSEGGISRKSGHELIQGSTVINQTKALINKAREEGLLIIYTLNTNLQTHLSDSPAWMRHRIRGRNGRADIEYTIEGTWGHRLVDGIEPRDIEVVVRKHRASAFVGTNLDLILRSNDIRTLLVTGILTESCVDSTARDAEFYDYFAIILRDCIDSYRKDLHEACLKIMEARFEVSDSKSIMEFWRRSSPAVENQREKRDTS